MDQEVEVEFQLNLKPALPATLVPLFRRLDGWQPSHCLKIHWPDVLEICGVISKPFLEDRELSRVVEALALQLTQRPRKLAPPRSARVPCCVSSRHPAHRTPA